MGIKTGSPSAQHLGCLFHKSVACRSILSKALSCQGCALQGLGWLGVLHHGRSAVKGSLKQPWDEPMTPAKTTGTSRVHTFGGSLAHLLRGHADCRVTISRCYLACQPQLEVCRHHPPSAAQSQSSAGPSPPPLQYNTGNSGDHPVQE